MAYYIYSSDGSPQGFRLGDHVYTMDGNPVAKVFAEKVYSLEGSYVGSLINNMVLDKPGVSRRNMPPSFTPPAAVPPGGAETRRPVCEAFPDCFDLLLPRASAPASSERRPSYDREQPDFV